MESKLVAIRLVVGIGALFAMGCSQQYRTMDVGLSGQDVIDALSEIETEVTASAIGSSAATQFFSLKNDDQSEIFWSQADESQHSPFGPPASVLSVGDLSFLGDEFIHATPWDLSAVRVAMIYRAGDGDSSCGLMIDTSWADTSLPSVISFFECKQVEVGPGSFVAVLENSTGQEITLRSFDLDQNGEFKDVIQLRIGLFDAEGEEVDVGKISTLMGFGS